VKKLSPQEISKWKKGIADENQNQKNDFKLLALNSVMKNVSVALPKLSPSKFPTTFVLKNEEIEVDEDSTDNEVIINKNEEIQVGLDDSTDDEVIIQKPVQIHFLNDGGKTILNNGGKKRSRSPSPSSSTSTMSLKEETPGNSNSVSAMNSISNSPTTSNSNSPAHSKSNSPTRKRLCRDSSASPEVTFATDENRKVLGTLKNQNFEDHEGGEKNVTRKRGRSSKTSPPQNSTKIPEIEEQIINEVDNAEENGDALNGRPHSRLEVKVIKFYKELRQLTLT